MLEAIVNFIRYANSAVSMINSNVHVTFFRPRRAKTATTRIVNINKPKTWGCCRPEALNAACSNRVSLFVI